MVIITVKQRDVLDQTNPVGCTFTLHTLHCPASRFIKNHQPLGRNVPKKRQNKPQVQRSSLEARQMHESFASAQLSPKIPQQQVSCTGNFQFCPLLTSKKSFGSDMDSQIFPRSTYRLWGKGKKSFLRSVTPRTIKYLNMGVSRDCS